LLLLAIFLSASASLLSFAICSCPFRNALLDEAMSAGKASRSCLLAAAEGEKGNKVEAVTTIQESGQNTSDASSIPLLRSPGSKKTASGGKGLGFACGAAENGDEALPGGASALSAALRGVRASLPSNFDPNSDSADSAKTGFFLNLNSCIEREEEAEACHAKRLRAQTRSRSGFERSS
jgi:hypothetical protein